MVIAFEVAEPNIYRAVNSFQIAVQIKTSTRYDQHM